MVKWLEFFCCLAWSLAVVNGNQFNLAKVKILKVGASCNTKSGESGVCKLLSKCGVYLEGLQKQTIEYSSIAICEHTFYDEVVCCPNTPSNPQSPKGFIASGTFKGTETFTEGPFEIPFEGQSVPEKVLNAGPICQTKTGEPGVCKLLSACGVYLEGLQKQTIEYSSIHICSFMGQDEVICCPLKNNLPTGFQQQMDEVFSGTFKGAEEVTEGPTEDIIEKPSEAGQILKVGASCNTKIGEPGVCKLLSKCGVYLEGLQKQFIEYSSIAICSFMGQDEVVCCPYFDTPSNPQLSTGFIASGTFKGTEPSTEGPFLRPSEGQSVPAKVLKAGSICQTKTAEPGVCKLLSACGVYMEGLQKQTIEYSSINICSFMGRDEVVCCPNNDLPTNHIEPPRMPRPPFTGTISSQNNTAVERSLPKTLKVGSICQTKTGEPGVCKLLIACGVYLEGLQKETIEYNSIAICSFIVRDEVVCCPNNSLTTNHNTLGHIPTETPIRPIGAGTISSQNNTEFGRPKKILKSGSICQTKTGEPGVCKLLSACGVYLERLQKETIEYSSINICSFTGQDEVVCCPYYETLSNPQSTTEFIASGPFNVPETVTEGPIEQPAVPEKVLTEGSICKTKTDQPGVCKLLSACGVYMKGLKKQTIEYSSINICSFMGQDEVVCCPNNHHRQGHIPTKPPRMPRPPITGTKPTQNNTEIGRPEKNLKSGSICKTKTGERGICKLLSACGIYMKGLQNQTIEYGSIKICSFMGQDDVVCCPNIPTQTPNIRIRGGPPPPSQNSSEVIRPAVTGFSKEIKRLDIFNIWLTAAKERHIAPKCKDVWIIFKNTYQIKSYKARNRIQKLCMNIRTKWEKSSQNESILLSKNNDWLNIVEVFTSVPVPNNQVRSKKTVKQLLDSYDARELITKAGLSEEQYQIIRNITNQKTEIEIFPDYDKVQNYTYPQKY